MTELLVIEKEVDIGRLSPCNIVFSDIKELSACHIKIIKTNENAILHMFGKNGGYINGRFFGQGEKTVLKYSDEISLFSIKVSMLMISPESFLIRTEPSEFTGNSGFVLSMLNT